MTPLTALAPDGDSMAKMALSPNEHGKKASVSAKLALAHTYLAVSMSLLSQR